jgi:hypothetical protein
MEDMTLSDAECLWLESLLEPFPSRSPAALAELFEQYLLPPLPAKTPARDLMAEGIAHLRKETV